MHILKSNLSGLRFVYFALIETVWCTCIMHLVNVHVSLAPSLNTVTTRRQTENAIYDKSRSGQVICDDELTVLIKLQANNMFFRKLSFLRRRGNETLWVILPRQYHMLPKQKWREKLKRATIITIKARLSSLKGSRHLNTKQFPSIVKLADQNLEFAYITQAQTK